MALVRVALVLVLTGIAFNEVSSFPKILELSLKEKQPEKELGKESSAIQIKNSEKELDPLDEDEESIARKILDRVPLIDGHNDLPDVIRRLAGRLANFNLTDLTNTEPFSSSSSSHTDILRLREGKLGAQFWVAYTKCASQYKDSPQKAFEQIDIIYRMIELYPETFQLATAAQEIEDIFAQGKIASLIGVEGGHAMGNSLNLLRVFYRMGVRYMTLTHSCPTSWADNSQLDDPGNEPIHGGLSGFGEAVVQEMNRLGMMVDISHVAVATMIDVLNVTQAPVIFSHSGAFAVCNHTRNVPDHVLRRLAENGGIIMVVFYNKFVTCSQSATLHDVVRHIEHIRSVIGVDHLGIGSDYNGVNSVPTDLEDVSKYPKLFAELLRRGWSQEDLEKLAGRNMLRVMRHVEQVKKDLSFVEPIEEWIPSEDVLPEYKGCVSDA